MGKNDCLIRIFNLRLYSVNQSSENDLLNESISVHGGLGVNQRSCHCPLLEKFPTVCGPCQDTTKLTECIPLDTGVSEVLPAASEVPHREE